MQDYQVSEPLDDPAEYWWQSGQAVRIGPAPTRFHKYNPATSQWEDSRSLQDFKDAQLVEVNAAFAAAGAALTAGYPEMEQKTWDIQRQEALAWRADSTVLTPFLDAAAQARGIPAATMRQLTLANVLAFQQAAAQAVGTRQALRDQINSYTEDTPESRAAVQAVVWPG